MSKPGAVTRAPRAGLAGGRNKSYSLRERMAARTIPQPSGCWAFQGCRVGNNGYGQIMRDPKSRKLAYAHRVAWELAHGAIPDDLRVLHRCDNPRCVNPEHLFLGTQKDNIHDAIAKGRFRAWGNTKLTVAIVQEIRRLSAGGILQREIAAQFGIARNTVSGIITGHAWGHLPELHVGDRVLQEQAGQAEAGAGGFDRGNQLADTVA